MIRALSAALALGLAAEPVNLTATAPPPTTAALALWEFQGQKTTVVVLSEEQAQLDAGKLKGCQDAYAACEVDDQRQGVSWIVWVVAGLAVGFGGGYFVARSVSK